MFHPSAIIDPGASIGEGTRVWHFTHIMPTAVIGTNCVIGQNVFIDNNTSIGNGVKIQNNVSVYNGLVIEDAVFIGPSVVFTNVINPRSFIERKNEFQTTMIRTGASIGANSTILCGIEIGAYAMIGAGAVLTKSVDPHAIMTGNPARRTGWISRAGHKLHFDDQKMATCPESGERYILKENRIIILE